MQCNAMRSNAMHGRLPYTKHQTPYPRIFRRVGTPTYCCYTVLWLL